MVSRHQLSDNIRVILDHKTHVVSFKVKDHADKDLALSGDEAAELLEFFYTFQDEIHEA